MQLTRKQLNLILLSLPDPRFVVDGKINRVLKVAVPNMLSAIPYDVSFREDVIIKTRELTFEFSWEEMDWVLKDLDI